MAGGRQPGGGREVHWADAEAAAGAEHQHQPRVHNPLRGEDPDQARAGESEVHCIESEWSMINSVKTTSLTNFIQDCQCGEFQ